MTHLDAVSFFTALLFLSVFVTTGLWNISVRSTSLQPVSPASGFRFTLCWIFFVTTVLILIEAARNMLDPGRWADERLFHGLAGETVVGVDEPLRNLLFGWILFPLRNLPLVEISPEGVFIGVVTLLFVLLTVEHLGRRTLKNTWQSRWTLTGTAAFLWLDVMTYSTVALLRQIAWMT